MNAEIVLLYQLHIGIMFIHRNLISRMGYLRPIWACCNEKQGKAFSNYNNAADLFIDNLVG